MNKFLLILFFITFSFQAQIKFDTSKDKISIPFELAHNLIIVEVEINNEKLKMILDTGSEQNVLFYIPENISVEFNNVMPIQIRGLGEGEKLEAILSRKNKLKIKELYNDNFEVVLLTNFDIGLVDKLGLPISGIIGTSFFRDYLVEINYIGQKINLYRNTTKSLKRRIKKYEQLDIKLKNNRPFVQLNINNDNKKIRANLLFDSGSSDALWLFENDTLKCTNKFFEDVLGKGLNGDILGKKSRVNSLFINNFEFKDALVSYPDSSSILIKENKDRNGSVGGEIIKRFNWFLDYNNNKFYYKANSFLNEAFHYNMAGIEVQNDGLEWNVEVERSTQKSTYNDIDALEYIYQNPDLKNRFKYSLKPNFVIHYIRKDSPADRVGLQQGDKILNINGKRAHDYDYQKITNLFQSEEGKKIKIKVEREGKILEFEFYLEKIL